MPGGRLSQEGAALISELLSGGLPLNELDWEVGETRTGREPGGVLGRGGGGGL